MGTRDRLLYLNRDRVPARFLPAGLQKIIYVDLTLSRRCVESQAKLTGVFACLRLWYTVAVRSVINIGGDFHLVDRVF